MSCGTIISKGESLQILMNQLRKQALEKRAHELKHATPAERERIMAQIEQDIRKEMRRSYVWFDPDFLLH